MRLVLILTLLLGMVLPSCTPEAPVSVTLATPRNGTTLQNLTPILSWNSSGSAQSYHVQLSDDADFQHMVIDYSGINALSYTVPAGRLENGESYYWRVSAKSTGGQSPWSQTYTFRSPNAAAAHVSINATLDGQAWSGPVNFSLTGPKGHSDNSVPASFNDIAPGTYAVVFNSGGPAGAALVSITPSPTQNLSSSDIGNFTLNFKSSAGGVFISSSVNGSSWSGPLDFTLTGPKPVTGNHVPQAYENLSPGSYTLSFNYGGPSGATLANISPAATQGVTSNSTTSFTLNFRQPIRSIGVNATLDGAPWSGMLNFVVSGPSSLPGISVPQNFSNLPAGTYTFNYGAGGPPGASLLSVTPGQTQSLDYSDTIHFTLNFGKPSGTITVGANNEGSPMSQPMSYTLMGPRMLYGSYVPETFNDMPAGTYTLVFNSVSVLGITYSHVTPPSQVLRPGSSIHFELSFRPLVPPHTPTPSPMPGPLTPIPGPLR